MESAEGLPVKSSSGNDQPNPPASGGRPPQKRRFIHYGGPAPRSADWLVFAVVAGLAIAAVVIIPPANREDRASATKLNPPARAATASNTAAVTNLDGVVAPHGDDVKVAP